VGGRLGGAPHLRLTGTQVGRGVALEEHLRNLGAASVVRADEVVGRPSIPESGDGKEGVDGSSPSEGFSFRPV
jgi:hypothetical protein